MSAVLHQHSRARRLLWVEAILDEPYQSAAFGYLEQLALNGDRAALTALLDRWETRRN